MLGSFHDAEDALQETMVRSWRGLPRYQGRSSLSSWLRRIATNVCLDAIARRPKRTLWSTDVRPIEWGRDEPEAPAREPVWFDPFLDGELGPADDAATPEARYEEREALELALSAALQHLPARQRAVLFLREVLGFSAKEVAEILGSTVAAANSSLQRARERLEERVSEPGQHPTLRSLEDASVRRAVERLVDAFEGADVAAILRLVAPEETPAGRDGATRRRPAREARSCRRPRAAVCRSPRPLGSAS
jgi:RNA polymerase sigma-70 factor (ECF subfamily)